MNDDEDNIRQYMPVLRRIIILVAVLTAIPVVMWTLTAVVRTYVGPLKAPTYQPMAATTPASVATEQAAAGPPNNSTTVSLPAPAPVVETKIGAMDNTAPGPEQTASLLPANASSSPMPADVTAQNMSSEAATPQSPQTAAVAVQNPAVPNSTVANPTVPNPTVTTANGPTPNGPNPAPMAAPSSAPDAAQLPSQQQVAPARQQVAEQQPDATNWPAPLPKVAAGSLPQGVPIAGPVPLPRRRPPTFVLALRAV
ncbi:MAG: hypothetical protein ACRECE_03970, partial [Xanthobacteraceae bacterium]